MTPLNKLKATLAGCASAVALASAAHAGQFDIPGGDLKTALHFYAAQAQVQIIVADEAIRGARTNGVHGDLSADVALTRILRGTGFTAERTPSGAIGVVHEQPKSRPTELADVTPVREAAAASVETVVVTSSKIKGDIQTVPIAITALSQEQLTSRQIAGGPDLVKEVPNLTFSKTNFTGYNIQIRGIGTQAISVTTDPAVAVAFNDMPFIRNHFFEQEFYDVSQVEVLRGPQGTLYGRNATAGVVNIISAKPTDQFEAMASADIGNYHNRRYEGMVNIPIVDDRLDVRMAAEWTKRDGYSFNEYTGAPIDGRDLWSSRVTIGLKPSQNLQMYVVWEHFQESDDRLRSAKQLCKRDPGVGSIDGVPQHINPGIFDIAGNFKDQGCLPVSLYSPEAFESPLGYVMPYSYTANLLGFANSIDPYVDQPQSRNLRVINSSIEPIYDAKNDVVELNADYAITPSLTFSSETGFNHDFLYSAEDFNRFGAVGGYFVPSQSGQNLVSNGSFCDQQGCRSAGIFCDPQLGCSDRLILEDLSQEKAWQLSQEFRLASNFSGPINFSAGANYLHYETLENYYVFSNVFTLISTTYGKPNSQFSSTNPWIPGVSDNSQALPIGFQFNDPTRAASIGGAYIDPNPLSHLNGNGHNYFRSKNPYVLNSYAGFGEVNYSVTNDLKLVGGLRWTDDQKHFLMIPSWVVSSGWGYPVAAVVDQEWSQFTGRAVANWTPKLDFTDQTLVYGSYSRGYKAGGANPPGAIFSSQFASQGGFIDNIQPTHPLTFKPEFVDAFELGTKNTLVDGGLTFNGDIFYYKYKDYQISEIVDRTAINLNFDATVKGAELETAWEPTPGLKFTFSGGYEDARLAKGEQAVDLIDRTAGHSGWYIVKPFVNEASNCVFPDYVAKNLPSGSEDISPTATSFCNVAYSQHLDPLTGLKYVANPTIADISHDAVQGMFPPDYVIPADYPGFDPASAPNNGAGFSKDLSGNNLPNAPHFTTSLSADYTLPVSEDWAATLHSDFYWQSQSYARVFNDRPYDKLRGYSNVNLALILTSADGWQVMGYLKNVFNTTAITGDFLNSDDTGLTTNVFLTDPRLYGVRLTRNW